MPDWNDFAPRMALVYDLFGNGRTAIKYSLNRYNLSRTTGIAANYNPLLQPDRRRCRGATSTATTSPTARCAAAATRAPPARSTSPNLAANYGIAALNEYGAYPRTWNLESGLEVQHELFDGVSVSGAWWKGNFHNLTTTINQSWTHGRLHAVHLVQPDHRPAVRGLRAQRRGIEPADAEPRHVRP